MTTVQWRFQALDTYFFREAAPFHAGEGGQGGQNGVFPPAMSTLQGAIRYQLALSRGWRPGDDRLPPELGDGDHLGDLRLSGPYLYYNRELLLPAPLFLLRLHDETEKTISYHRLFPGKAVSCDLGCVRLPAMPEKARGAKLMDTYWLSTAAMGKTLAGGTPEDGENEEDAMDKPAGLPANGVVDSRRLWQTEAKVGIGREADTRTAMDKNLYAINLVRPVSPVSLSVGVAGIPLEWSHAVTQKVANLGGEGKLAWLHLREEPVNLPSMPQLKAANGKIRFTVTLITPGYFGSREQTQDAVKGLAPWINYPCITACVGKFRQIGGWDLKANRPRPLRPYIPAGSTWFFEAEASSAEAIGRLHGRYIGEKASNAYGYGQILIGRWEETI